MMPTAPRVWGTQPVKIELWQQMFSVFYSENLELAQLRELQPPTFERFKHLQRAIASR